MKCPKCGSLNITVSEIPIVKTKYRGCLGWLIWIILACCTCGLILIIPALSNSKSKTKIQKRGVCQQCAYSWNML